MNDHPTHYVELFIGVTGPPGPDGPAGPPGVDGPQGPQGPPDEAPLDGVFYGRQDAAWVPLPPLDYLPLAGGALTGALTVSAGNESSISLESSAALPGASCFLQGYFAGTQAGWAIRFPDASPRTGANAGANFVIDGYSDVGDVLNTPFSIERATGVTSFSILPSIPGGALGDVLRTDGAGGLSWTAVLPGGPYLPMSAGVAAPLAGELYLPPADPSQPAVATHRAYVDAQDALLQDQITRLASNLLFVGGIDVPADVGTYTIASGLTNGPLPAPSAANTGFYVIVIAGGVPPVGNIPAGIYAAGDWLVSGGTQWVHLPIGQPLITAVDVAINPAIGALGANVHTGLTWLDAFKLSLAGGTMTGPLVAAPNDGLIIDGPLAANRNILGRVSGVTRWSLALGVGGELDTNSVFRLQSFDNAGALIATALLINGANSGAVFAGPINAGSLAVTSDVTATRNIVGGFVQGATVSGTNNLSISHAIGSAYPIDSMNNANNGLRWRVNLGNGLAETGANAGTDFAIQRYDDASTGATQNLIGRPLVIERATGVCTFEEDIVQPSDLRRKENVSSVANALDIVTQLNGFYYNNVGQSRRKIGLSAQDLAAVLPEVVYQIPPLSDEEATAPHAEPMLGVSYPKITALLINAIKELKSEVDVLKARQSP